jgi:hypothetical protein
LAGLAFATGLAAGIGFRVTGLIFELAFTAGDAFFDRGFCAVFTGTRPVAAALPPLGVGFLELDLAIVSEIGRRAVLGKRGEVITHPREHWQGELRRYPE